MSKWIDREREREERRDRREGGSMREEREKGYERGLGEGESPLAEFRAV